MAWLKKSSVAGWLLLALAPWAGAKPQEGKLPIRPASVVQRLVDRARPGATVRLPAGVFVGSVTVRKNIGLVGAGVGRTILDGQGADRVLLVESAALVARMTVRGGQIGVELRGPDAILQDTLITANKIYGVHCLASPVLFNNRILANGTGVAVNSRSPVLLHNTIAGNGAAGVWSWYGPGPALLNDLVADNKIALDDGAGSSPEIANSYEWGHVRPSAGFREVDPGPDAFEDERAGVGASSPLAQSVDLSPLLRLKPGAADGATFPVGYLGSRRAEVELDRGKARAYAHRNEPQLTYRLTGEPGVFQVEVTFSRPPFQLGSSETTASIEVLKAWDDQGTVRLHADVRRNGTLLGVQVDSFEPDPPLQAGRYHVLCEFQDPAAWRDVGGKMVFQRVTSVEGVRIVPPEGWTLRRLPSVESERGRVLSAEAVPPGAQR